MGFAGCQSGARINLANHIHVIQRHVCRKFRGQPLHRKIARKKAEVNFLHILLAGLLKGPVKQEGSNTPPPPRFFNTQRNFSNPMARHWTKLCRTPHNTLFKMRNNARA